MVQCPACDGRKVVPSFVDFGDGPHGELTGRLAMLACETCRGTGSVAEAVVERHERGRELTRLRINYRISYHDLAEGCGLTSAEVSEALAGRGTRGHFDIVRTELLAMVRERQGTTDDAKVRRDDV